MSPDKRGEAARQSTGTNGVGSDPNLAGSAETAQLHDWQAGKLGSFMDNEDYKVWLQSDKVPESRLHDGGQSE